MPGLWVRLWGVEVHVDFYLVTEKAQKGCKVYDGGTSRAPLLHGVATETPGGRCESGRTNLHWFTNPEVAMDRPLLPHSVTPPHTHTCTPSLNLLHIVQLREGTCCEGASAGHAGVRRPSGLRHTHRCHRGGNGKGGGGRRGAWL